MAQAVGEFGKIALEVGEIEHQSTTVAVRRPYQQRGS
jgi:hypothetical protein